LPASLNVVIAQRLVKKLCSCKQKVALSELGKDVLLNVKNAINITPKDELMSRV
jgi:type II secretory ATPase GspE/PulE/Tfp pilus assembly ATPase PilB-like protein